MSYFDLTEKDEWIEGSIEMRFVCYYRLSKDWQRQPGSGLEAQKKAVVNYLGSGSWEIVGEYTEIERAANEARTELQKAMSECKLKNARLIVAKLSRLSSDLEFITVMRHGGVKFIFAEAPELDESTADILLVIAHHERRLISECTREALARAKMRGVQLGNPCFTAGKQIPGSGNTEPARQEKSRLAREYAARIRQEIEQIEESGSPPLRTIAAELNNRGFRTRRDKPWSATAVMRILRAK